MKEKLKNLRRANRKLGIVLDSIKSFLIVVIVFTLIVLVGSSIIHNILRFGEVSSKYTGEYKELYPVGSKMMNIYTTGEGVNTILILSGFGVQSPVLEYKALADSLSSQYRIVIVEYLGYGFSLSTNDERTNEKIIEEVREGLNSAEIYGPFFLMAFDTSNVYANYYSKKYPEEVSGIISIDGMYANAIEDSNFKDDYLPNLVSNVNFYSIIALSGVFRWESYLKPAAFNIDDMINNSSYGDKEIKVYRNLIANKFLTKPMKKEIHKLEDNMKEMKDYIYPENLPTLQILTSNNIEQYSKRGIDLNKYSENMITTENIQIIKEVDGDLSDYLFKKDKIKQIKQIINLYF